MKESPILFTTEMVQAILAGRKTQTRRIVKPQPGEGGLVSWSQIPEYAPPKWAGYKLNSEKEEFWKCRYGYKGDLLWVKETYCLPKAEFPNAEVIYKADQKWPDLLKWKSSYYMPKRFARIWLRVKDIRVERVQDITAADAIAEGLERSYGAYTTYYRDYISNESHPFDNPVLSYMSLWLKINGRDKWDANPWVWVIEFERV